MARYEREIKPCNFRAFRVFTSKQGGSLQTLVDGKAITFCYSDENPISCILKRLPRVWELQQLS